MISQASLDEIKAKARIADAIGDVVQLTRRGNRFVGLCPFHNEKSPSFHVNDEDNFYHCFGCGESGNIFTWYMKTQGLSFPEAAEAIAQRFNLTLERSGKKSEAGLSDNKKALYNINALAKNFFQQSLEKADSRVQSYLQERGLTPDVIQYFSVGFAPAGWNNLSQYLLDKGIAENLLELSGLVRRNSKGEFYDTFRARIIFPVWVDGRRIAGFGGRAIPALIEEKDKASVPKYLNSPETPVYNKSTVLFGLAQALPPMRDTKEALLVEGYLDVISLHAAGVQTAIATCGTAITEGHVKRLSTAVNKVALLFDGDNAGRAAAAKSFPLFINSGLDTLAIFLPQGEDPDTIARQNGNATAEYLLTCEKRSLLECYVNYLIGRAGFADLAEVGAAQKGKLAEELSKDLKRIQNDVERDELIKQAASILRIDKEQLARFCKQGAPAPTSPKKPLAEVAAELESSASGPVGGPGGHVAIKSLNKVEQQLLQAVMVDKENMPAKILASTDFVQELHPVSLRFISELQSIISDISISKEQKKPAIKTLLQSFGPGWLEYWKQSYQIVADKSVDLSTVFDECRQAYARRRIERSLKLTEQLIIEAQTEEERASLIQSKINLIKTQKR